MLPLADERVPTTEPTFCARVCTCEGVCSLCYMPATLGTGPIHKPPSQAEDCTLMRAFRENRKQWKLRARVHVFCVGESKS